MTKEELAHMLAELFTDGTIGISVYKHGNPNVAIQTHVEVSIHSEIVYETDI